jgi:hypothetical protein
MPYDIHGGQSDNGAGFFVFPLLMIIPPLLPTDLSLPPEMCDNPDQAKHHIFIL